MSTAVPQPTPSSKPQRASFWLRELPFSLVLVLTILGVAYTSFSKQPIIGYWEVLAPIIGLVCVASGWQSAADNAARLRLITTQALHWLAFLVVMNLLLLPSVQRSLHCWLHRVGDFYVAHAWHLHRRCPYPFLANLPARADYGARHSGHGVDREFGFDCRADCGERAGNCRSVLVALAGQTRAVKPLNDGCNRNFGGP